MWSKASKQQIIMLSTFYATFAIIFTIAIVLVYVIFRDVANVVKKSSQHKKNFASWYELNFPEEEFMPGKKYHANYFKQIAIGKGRMEKENIVICGLVQNCEHSIKKTIIQMTNVGAMFNSYKIIIYENGSIDKTREILNQLVRTNQNIILLKEDKFAIQNPSSKTCKLSSLRNNYVNFVREHFSHFDYMMVIDLDMDGTISLNGLATCFGQEDNLMDWDAMSANGMCSQLFASQPTLKYYDHNTLMYVGETLESMKLEKMQTKKFMSQEYKRGQPLVKVHSAFGGCIIYKLSSVLESGAIYSCEHNEHITFNNRLASRGFDKIYINPSFILLQSFSKAIL